MDIRGVEAVVAGVGGDGRRGDDGVGLVAVGDGVIDAGDGDGLRNVPSGRREEEGSR